MGRKIGGAAILAAAIGPGFANALEFEGFGSVSYHNHDVEGKHANISGEYPEGFTLGGFDLYAFQEIGEKTSAFAEFIIADFEEEIELERLWIKRTFSPKFAFKAGLIESPLGYWNRTYRHGGQLLQDTITRPFFLRYEEEPGAIFPMVSVGIELLGAVTGSRGELKYNLLFSNGMSVDSGAPMDESAIHINMLGDPGDEKLVVGRVAYHFSGIPFHIGVFGMSNPVVESGEGGNVRAPFAEQIVKQTVVGSDFQLSLGEFEMFGEYYQIDNEDSLAKTGTYSASAYYVQVGYQLTERLKPLYRYVSLDRKGNDPYFNILRVPGQTHHVYGVRYDLDDSNALKLEYHEMDMGEQEMSHFQVQWAFLMF